MADGTKDCELHPHLIIADRKAVERHKVISYFLVCSLVPDDIRLILAIDTTCYCYFFSFCRENLTVSPDLVRKVILCLYCWL